MNRPTPGSQRPAEPVATGLLQGVKTSKNRGQFSGLGVKLWVVDDGLSQRRAILYGVKIGVVAIFEHFSQVEWWTTFQPKSLWIRAKIIPFFLCT